MRLENETIRQLIDQILSGTVNQNDIDSLSFFLYPHTTKYKRTYDVRADSEEEYEDDSQLSS
jgi:hypothetical protein